MNPEAGSAFAAAAQKARKAVYGPRVGEAMRQRLAKWPVRH